MKSGVRTFGLLALLGLVMQSAALAQCVSLTTVGSAVSQNFDTLATTGTTNNLTITGWFLTESGGGARDNEQYAADNGAGNTGDTISYGASAATDRALGGLRSGTLIPIFGACFTNNTGVTLNALQVGYTGEQWRLGTTGRTDQIDFQYSTNATDLVTGSWIDVNALDFVSPFTTTAGARDGNLAANRTALSHTIPGLAIANGATFWIRWTDLDASGADDGLAVDDFALTPTSDPCAAISYPYTLPNNTPITLINAITCANLNGASADVINLNGQTVTLTNSFANYDGGTALPRIESPITLRNGTITRSGSNEFRFLYINSTGNLTLRDITLSNGGGTTYNFNGGALYASSGSTLAMVRTTVTGSSVSDNANAGGVFSSGQLSMTHCAIHANRAGRGGGMVLQNGPITITNSVISGNAAFSLLGGGGIYVPATGGFNATMVNTTITGNYTTATNASAPGGILGDISGPNLILRNSIVWGNRNANASAPQIVNTAGTNTVTTSIIEGGQFGALNGDPLFLTPLVASTAPSTAGDFRLGDASPAIDAGANADVVADAFDINGNSNTTEDAPDFAGNPRRYDDTGVSDTGTGTAPIVDLGAYEKQTNTPGSCAAITFPYTLPDNAPATLITAVECANANGTADEINLNGQTVALTASYANACSGEIGLPQITTPITMRNGALARSGATEFRFLCIMASGNLTLVDMTVTNGLLPNLYVPGGAIMSGGTLVVRNSTFSNNNARLGGAIHSSGPLTVLNSTFSSNGASNGISNVGGAIFATGLTTILNSTFSGNSITGGDGSALSLGANAQIRNTVVSGNTGGVAISVFGGTSTFTNLTITGNHSPGTRGGLLATGPSSLALVYSSLIWNNSGTGIGGASGGSISAGSNIIQGINPDGPLFVAPITLSATPSTAGDFRLQPNSPGIDAGNNTQIAADAFDVDGDSNTSEDTPDRDLNVRRYDDIGVADSGTGSAPLVDMGAYERQTNSPVNPCAAIVFPYTLPNNLAATLVTAMECANANGASADVIDFNGQIVTLTSAYASYLGATGLPQVSTAITLENGALVRNGGAPQFRLLSIAAGGSLTLDGMTASGGSLSASDNAGAIYNDGGTLTIRNSTLTNHSAGFGGALYNSGAGASMVLADSQLTNNSASQNGGLLMNDSGHVSIRRSTVSGNSSSGPSGNGAIYNFGASLDIVDSMFSGNTATTSVGAVQNFAGTVRIANSVFAGNSAANSSSAVLNNAAGVMTISNSRFTGNRVQNAGAAVFNNGSTLTLSNSTVAGNSAASGGGMQVAGGTTTIRNSILWGNSGNALAGASITYSIIEGGFAGVGNLNVDPLFMAPVAFAAAPTSVGNYHLQDHSPAVDAGDNAAVPLDIFDLNDNASTTDEAPDLDGNPRRYDDTGIADTGAGTAPVVDMGAFEKQTNSPILFPMEVDYCNLQFPTSITVAAGSTTPIIYGRIFEDDNGVLTSAPGAHPGIVAQLGHGPLGSDPRGGNPAWVWFPASYNVQVGNDDEYQGTFTVPFVPTNTQRSYTYRFSVDSGLNYTYCDTNGNGTNSGLGFSTALLGTLTVNPGGQPTLSINDVSQNEGNSGTTAYVFTVSLNGPSLSPVTFDIATANNTATVANNDYVANSATGVVIPAGQTSTAFQVLVNGDTTFEPNESFLVNVTNVVGATVGDAQGLGTILNDDVDPCAAYTFPYTMTGNTPAELIQAIHCANSNGASADRINLNGQTVTLTEIHTSAYGSGTGLPEITTAVVIENGTITRSSADLFRFFIYSGTSSLTLNNITLSNGNPEWDGGAIWGLGSASLIINHSRIIGNYGNYGGAIFIPTSGTAVITNTLLSGNRAGNPGGAIRNRGTLTLNNSTIAANFTTAGTEGGGGIANNGGTVVLNNSIVFGNESSSFPATHDIRGTFTANNSLVGVNPAFVNLLDAGDTAPTTAGDYRLANFSVAIDAGDNSLIPGGVTTDLDGNPRRYNDTGVVDTGVGSVPIVDIGAYEKQTNSALPQADLTISKTDGQATAAAGSTVTYTIVVNNPGPSAAPGASVADTFPALCVSPTWTCVGAGSGTCTASGSGNIADTVNLPVGGSVIYTALCPLGPAASGTLSNTATVSTPSGVVDPNPGNNSSSDVTTVIAAPVVSIDNVEVVETDGNGLNAVFTVTRSTTGTAFTVDFATAAGTAVAGSDYTSTSGTLSFAADTSTTRTISVPITGDVRVEGSESFTVSLSNPTGTASIGTGIGTGTITDNDSATVQFAPTSVSQSEASSPMVFTVTLSHPVQSGVTLSLNSAPGTATAADFTPISGLAISFAPDSITAQTVNVVINNDLLDEDNEQYTLTLSGLSAVGNVTLPAGTATATGIIEDDDALPVLSVANVSQVEGDVGTSLMTFTVNLAPVSGRDVSFTRATVDGTATAPSDFVALAASVVTIPAGQTSLTIPVTINGDTTFEGDESYTLALSSISNATPGSLSATGTIEDDDQQSTTTLISADLPDPSVVGQGYPVLVTVNGQSSSPLGQVSVDDGTGASCTAVLVPGTAPASSMSCTLTSTSAGSKTLAASYVPASSAFAASSDTETHQVDAAATSLQLTGPATVRINTLASYTASLSVTAPGSGTPAGTVTVSSGAQSCQITLPTATPNCALSFATLGSRAVTASFVPSDTNYLGASASAVTTLVFASTDLVVSKTNGQTSYQPNDLLVYTIEVQNLGPDAAPEARILDPVPAGLTNVAWTCVGQGGAFCPSAGGVNGLDMQVLTLPSGGRLVISYYGNVMGNVAQIVNEARVELPASGTLVDPEPGNNSATDIDRLDQLLVDGFESPVVNGPTGSVALDTDALRSVLGRTAWSVLALDDVSGVAARVYVRMLDERMEYALATRDGEGRLRLGAWQSYAGTPTLRWTAEIQPGGWRLNQVWIAQ